MPSLFLGSEAIKFPPILHAEHDDIEYGTPLGSVRVTCPNCVPYQPLVSLKLLTARTTQEDEMSLALGKYY